MDETKYHIAEIFIAPQGEGRWVGKLMAFVRLAGCTVGTLYPKNYYVGLGEGSNTDGIYFPIYTNECHIYDGRTMPCDTDYRRKEKLTADEIVTRIQSLGDADIICLTGGEPLMHDVTGLVDHFKNRDYRVHLETSGTIPVIDVEKSYKTVMSLFDYIAVSPKEGFLPQYVAWADELKILVDENFYWDNLPEEIRNVPNKIYLQPINGEHEINMENVDRCLTIQKEHHEIMISLQSHKAWRTR